MADKMLKNLPMPLMDGRHKPHVLWMKIIVGIGVLLRLKHYFEFRSLWLDEAWLSLMISGQPWKEILLFRPFSVDLPVPPAGFLIAQKSLVYLIGNSPETLRILPLLSSIGALLLFRSLVQRMNLGLMALFPIAVMAWAEPFVYYAAEVKQYSSDLFIALCCAWILDDYLRHRTSHSLVSLGFAGVFVIYFSHTAIFLLCSMAFVMVCDCFLQKNYVQLLRLSLPFLFWFCVFMVLFLFSLQPQSDNPRLVHGAQLASYYPSSKFFSYEGMRWTYQAVMKIFSFPIPFFSREAGGVLFLIGAWMMLKKNIRFAVFFLLPPVICLCLAWARKYPFGDRFILFAAPGMLIVIATGLQWITQRILANNRILSYCLVILCLASSAVQASTYVLQSRQREDMGRVMKYFGKHYLPGDSLFINNEAQYAFSYYAGIYDLPKVGLIGMIVDDTRPKKVERLEIRYRHALHHGAFWIGYYRGKEVNAWIRENRAAFKTNSRVWFILAHYSAKQRAWLEQYLDKKGKRILFEESNGAVAYLYDLSGQGL
ncbi:MAG: hypothetical protein KC713_05135 [Candidatus Omnitrophica bacterium]|nr:hypothetical protein [Candidatus Omnitrophota bacterium]